MAAFSARDALTPPRTIKRGPDLPARQVLAKAGMSARFVDEVLRPFFAGVFLVDDAVHGGSQQPLGQ